MKRLLLLSFALFPAPQTMSDSLTINPCPVISPTGIIHVLGYTPTEGERGVPITVRIHFHPDLADAMYVRLVVGNKAVPTRVRQLQGLTYGRWQLHAAAPPFDRLQPSTKVLISIQALNEENAILDSVTFGQFSYWAPGSTPDQRPQAGSVPKLPRLQIPDSTSLRRRSTQHLPTPSPTASERSPFPKSPQLPVSTRLHRRMKPQSLVRTKHHSDHLADQEDMYAQTPVLDLITPLQPICVGWSPAEVSAGRRLVRFLKVQDGRRVIVSCEPIAQEEYCESDNVISCIHREGIDTCFVTSVDVIYLLERLTNGEFPVEEKNRIRRNLEGLRPTTVSKHKAGFGDFFQRIMDFPDPKPRNIEKDLKVFEWNLLGQALEKILSKYSIYTSPMPEGGESSSVETSSTESPELYAVQLSYPPPEEQGTSRFLDQKVCIPRPKYEPLEEFHPTSDAFVSPVESTITSSSSSSAFPLFASETTEPVKSEESHTWASGLEFNKPNEMALEHYPTYEAVEPGGDHGFGDFSLYDNFGIADENMASIAENYI